MEDDAQGERDPSHEGNETQGTASRGWDWRQRVCDDGRVARATVPAPTSEEPAIFHALEHPKSPALRAEYGWDRTLGFFVKVALEDRILLLYDRHRPGYDGVTGALQALADHAFFRTSDIAEAHGRLVYFAPDEIENPSVARCAHVIAKLRRPND